MGAGANNGAGGGGVGVGGGVGGGGGGGGGSAVLPVIWPTFLQRLVAAVRRSIRGVFSATST
jgi:hypothetical protein